MLRCEILYVAIQKTLIKHQNDFQHIDQNWLFSFLGTAIPELPRNMSAARGPKPTLGFATTIKPKPKWKPNSTAKWSLNIDTTKEPKAKAKPKANRTHMGKTNTDPNINWKPKPKWDCLDCGFAMEVCCKYYNGSASCQKLSDCQTDSQSLSYTPLRKVDRYHASLRKSTIN